ncbi:MAG: hypothetical protein JKY70_14090 [Mucilaginibacter sp.]|nr:hypothetical protein [Mucilaginibacter sp.]
MDAVVVDLKDFGNRTPEQAIRVFLKMYGGGKARADVFNLFRSMAGHGMLNDKDAVMNAEQIALLFDQLIALAEAVEKLMAGEQTDPRCVVCGSIPEKNS